MGRKNTFLADLSGTFLLVFSRFLAVHRYQYTVGCMSFDTIIGYYFLFGTLKDKVYMPKLQRRLHGTAYNNIEVKVSKKFGF